MTDFEQGEYLATVAKAGKKGVTTEKMRSMANGEADLQWANGNFLVEQNPVTKAYHLSYKGRQSLDFYKNYGF